MHVNWDAIGALAEVAGALGVIASLVYLAIQIRQNTRSARETAWHSGLRELQQFRSLIAQDPEVARIYREGLRDLKSLSDDDRWRFGALMQSIFSVFETAFRTRKEGRFPDQLDNVVWIASRPGAREWWSKGKRLYSPEFQRLVDETFESSRKPPSHPAV
jgi:hypothetical protein